MSLLCEIKDAETGSLLLVEPDHETFRTGHFKSRDSAIPPHHIRLEPKPNDFGSIRFSELRDGRPAIDPLDLLLHRCHIRYNKIYLHPSGRARRPEILPDNNEQTPVTVPSETVCLRMVSPLYHRHLQNGFKELFV
jgi:hypothetical protein